MSVMTPPTTRLMLSLILWGSKAASEEACSRECRGCHTVHMRKSARPYNPFMCFTRTLVIVLGFGSLDRSDPFRIPSLSHGFELYPIHDPR